MYITIPYSTEAIKIKKSFLVIFLVNVTYTLLTLHKRGEFCSLHHHHINGNSIRRITSLSFRSDEQNH